MKPRVVGTVFSAGLAALLAGALAAVPAAASVKDLHVVASPVISNSSLSGAAVIAPGDMWAVGDIGTGSGPFQTLAEHFNGTSWSVVPTPALNASLSGVAGAAGNDVWAVGDQAQGSSVSTLIEHWDGTSWSVVSSPKLPKGSQLTGVTAPAAGNAWATGFAAGSADALMEHWDGTRWSIVSSPAFTGVTITGGISADSSTDVWAMGFLATSSTTTQNVSLHWDGTSWTQIPAVHLRFGGVGPVTALSPANVWAVGTGPGVPTGGFSAHPTAVIEHWDGTSWSIVDTPGGVSFLAGMAASSSGHVLAVGQGTNQSGIILSN
jgi:hypothetical protein